MKHYYFVSYSITEKNGQVSHGRVEFESKTKITKISQIATMEEKLGKSIGSDGVLLTHNFILLRRSRA